MKVRDNAITERFCENKSGKDVKKIGEEYSLTTPHIYKLPLLKEGVHTVIVRVNNTDYPVKVVSSVGGGSLTVSSMASITIWVEGWAPVPKVRPGSRITFFRWVS